MGFKTLELTQGDRAALPPLYSQDGKGMEANAHVKFFLGSWTWYATEFDGEDTFFGYVESGLGLICDELGYFSLSELQSVRGQFGLPVERDDWFVPAPLSTLVRDKWAA
jgi:hypothetical protein